MNSKVRSSRFQQYRTEFNIEVYEEVVPTGSRDQYPDSLEYLILAYRDSGSVLDITGNRGFPIDSFIRLLQWDVKPDVLYCLLVPNSADGKRALEYLEQVVQTERENGDLPDVILDRLETTVMYPKGETEIP